MKRNIIGYDANSFCLYCLGDVMSCGKDRFSKNVLNEKVFGFAHVGIELNDKLYDKFSKIALLFVVQETPDSNIPEKIIMDKKEMAEKNSLTNQNVTRSFEIKNES